MYSPENMTFAEWLIEELRKRDWTQSDLAKKSGLNKATISNYLREYRYPDKESIIRLSKALNLPPDTLYRAAGLLPPVSNQVEMFEEWKYLLSQLPEHERERLYKIGKLILEEQPDYENPPQG